MLNLCQSGEQVAIFGKSLLKQSQSFPIVNYQIKKQHEHSQVQSTLSKMDTIDHRKQHQLSVLERSPAYKEFRYSKMTEKRHAGTNKNCHARIISTKRIRHARTKLQNKNRGLSTVPSWRLMLVPPWDWSQMTLSLDNKHLPLCS